MTTLYFLDAAEFTDVSAVAAAQPGARVERLPGYVTVTAEGPLVIDRRATGVRHSVLLGGDGQRGGLGFAAPQRGETQGTVGREVASGRFGRNLRFFDQ